MKEHHTRRILTPNFRSIIVGRCLLENSVTAFEDECWSKSLVPAPAPAIKRPFSPKVARRLANFPPAGGVNIGR